MGTGLEAPAPLRLGVTGHRILAEVDRLRAAVGDALHVLERQFPGRPPCIYSALAEGADRLVVEEVLAREPASLVAVLPMPAGDYARDFSSASSRRQFELLMNRAADIVHLPRSRSRDDAYWQAGRYVVEHADVLVALWDGQPAQGANGTADVVAYARACARPLIWIRAGNREPGTDIPTTLGDEQGLLTVENLAGFDE